MRRRIALYYPKATFRDIAYAIVDFTNVPIDGIAASIIAVKTGSEIRIRVTKPRFFPGTNMYHDRNRSPSIADAIRRSADAIGCPLSSLTIDNCFKAGLLIVPASDQLTVRIQKPVVVSAKKEIHMNGIVPVAGNIVGRTAQFAAQQLNRSDRFTEAPIPSERSGPRSSQRTDHQQTICPLVLQARKTPERVIYQENGVQIEYRNIPENTLFIAKTRSEAKQFVQNLIQQNRATGAHQKIVSRGLIIIPPVPQNNVYLVQAAPKSDRARRAEAEAELAEIKTRYSRAFEYLDRHPWEIEKIETYVNRFITNSRIATVSNIGISTLNVVGSVATGFGVTAIPTIVAAVFAEVGEQQLRADCRAILQILEVMKTQTR